MNKGELIIAVQAKLALTPTESKNLVENISDILKDALVADGEVTLPGLGKLKLITRPGRPGRNPRTGDAITIEEKKVVKFSASSFFKIEINTTATATPFPTTPAE